jgi:hypothetical protein
MAPGAESSAKYQFTIGHAMIVIAVVALLLTLIRFGLLLLVLSVVALGFYLLLRHVRITPAAFLIAAFALLLLMTRFGLAAVVMNGLIVGYYVVLHNFVLSGPPIPRRRGVKKPRFPQQLPRR